ncbi:hypothetical protein PHMEG_00016562 [Phytophthora megakarya]|uniref:Uncharacterized protein n=1 Tax=Phytophthora megakarya TaxID=4795 RepID=A0A225W029_9STRA|nr:hypothetical protein PHMEG_00016562 [Phytophthora megakarya]
MELVEARRKKRKAGTPAASSAPPVQITTTEFPPDSPPSILTLAAAADRELPCDEDIVYPTIDGDQRTSSDICTTAVSAATAAPADAALSRHGRPPQASEFNLDEFAQDFTGHVPAPPSAVPRPSLTDQVDQLFQMFFDLCRELQVAATERQGQLSQPRQLCCSSFPLPRVRVKGEYYPPQAHQLAAHRMFRDLNSDEGRWLSPMSFVLHVRELECVRFDAPPAVLMAVFSGRLGSRIKRVDGHAFSPTIRARATTTWVDQRQLLGRCLAPVPHCQLQMQGVGHTKTCWSRSTVSSRLMTLCGTTTSAASSHA